MACCIRPEKLAPLDLKSEWHVNNPYSKRNRAWKQSSFCKSVFGLKTITLSWFFGSFLNWCLGSFIIQFSGASLARLHGDVFHSKIKLGLVADKYKIGGSKSNLVLKVTSNTREDFTFFNVPIVYISRGVAFRNHCVSTSKICN